MGIINDAVRNLPSPESMGAMTWNELYALRLKHSGDIDAQEKIAPFEHQAYAREAVQENPLTAPVWAIMPAAYQAFKAIGGGEHDDMTTPPSLDQAVAGVKGVVQGIGNAIRNVTN